MLVSGGEGCPLHEGTEPDPVVPSQVTPDPLDWQTCEQIKSKLSRLSPSSFISNFPDHQGPGNALDRSPDVF